MMESTDKNIEYTPITTQNDITNSSTMSALVELTQYYQEGAQRYAQEIQNYNLEIQKAKDLIAEAVEATKEDEEVFAKCAREVSYYARGVGDSNEVFHQNIASIEELQQEYKESMEASEYMKILKKKKSALGKLLDKIAEREEELLNHELERLNVLEKLIPKRKHIEDLKVQLKTLEREKTHFESSQLQKTMQLPKLNTPTKEVIDIDTVEE